MLNISRSSVIRAYELLVFEGIIFPVGGSGYIISENDGKPKLQQKENNTFAFPKISEAGQSFKSNEHLLNSTSDELLAFRPGLPPLDVFPLNIWKNLYNIYWRNVKMSSLNYSNASGLLPLKRHIASYLYITRGFKCSEEQILIVSGSLQSLFLLGSALIDQSDQIVIEKPTFPNVQSIFSSLRAEIFASPLDASGLDLSTIPKEFSPKVIHCTPSGHYPTGVEMSEQRKLEILNYASEKKAIIIENDYEHEISNYQKRKPSLFEMDKEGRTVFLGTFNRLLHPSIRMGYMVVPFYLLDYVKALQKHSHRFVSSSGQLVLSEFIRKDHIYEHIRNVITTADERKRFFVDEIEKHIHPSFKIEDSPAASLHLLAKFPQAIPDIVLVEELKKHHLIAHPYSKCFLSDKKNGIILGYAAVRKHLMENRLAELIKVYNKLAEERIGME